MLGRMQSAVTIRDGDPNDRATLLEFHRALYVDHQAAVLPAQEAALVAYRDFERVLRDDVDGLLRGGAHIVLIAERGAEPVGYITGHVEREPLRVCTPKGVVEDWFVVERARGGGVGTRLLGALEARFRDAGCAMMESATWASNRGAREAHRARGFTEIQVVFRKPL